MRRLRPELLPQPPGRARRVPRPFSVAVCGGGLAGVAAATVLAERGARVTLLEKEPYLGGRVGAWSDRLGDGEPFQMERGFHAFFRQYYNLRALLRRVDPALEALRPLDDYPILGPDGAMQSFKELPTAPPWNVLAVATRSPALRLRDLLRVDARAALTMLAYDPRRTYARWDHVTARAYLDSLRFPERARRLLFDVFCHSFFNAEEELSAAELLMMFHFYFCGNPEGLVFEVARRPFAAAIWEPYRRWLAARGVDVRLSTAVRAIARVDGRLRVDAAGAAVDADAVVLALSVPALKDVVRRSPDLHAADFARRVGALATTRPFAVWRLWLDRRPAPDRAPFVGTAGVGLLESISLYHRLEDESARFAARTGGAVVELHGYALTPDMDEDAVRADLLAGLHALYPETRAARILHERFLVRADCPAFTPGSHALRPTVETPHPDLALAGDCIKLPFPSALMERAAASGILAANHLLRALDVTPEPIRTVPRRGLLAPALRRA